MLLLLTFSCTDVIMLGILYIYIYAFVSVYNICYKIYIFHENYIYDCCSFILVLFGHCVQLPIYNTISHNAMQLLERYALYACKYCIYVSQLVWINKHEGHLLLFLNLPFLCLFCYQNASFKNISFVQIHVTEYSENFFLHLEKYSLN